MVRVVVQQPLLSLFDGPRALDDQAMLTQGHALLRKRVRREALEKASLRQAVPRRNPPTLTSHHPTPPAMATQILDEISAKLQVFPLFEFCVWIYLDLRRPALQVALLPILDLPTAVGRPTSCSLAQDWDLLMDLQVPLAPNPR